MESRKILQSQKKKDEIKKNISESRKIFQNGENYFKIEKNGSESRKILLQESRKNFKFNDLEFNEPYLLRKIKNVKEIYYNAQIQLSNYTSHVKGLSIKGERCDLFTTPLTLSWRRLSSYKNQSGLVSI